MNPDTRLVLVGGGHSHVEVLRRLAMAPPPCNVTVVARDLIAPYSGMLPGFVAGTYDHAQCHIDVRTLARNAGARVCHAEVTGIDFDKHCVRCAGRPDVPFDLLSLNVGSRPAVVEVPGAAQYALPAKPVDQFIARWEATVDELTQRPRAHRVAVVGAGAGGVELALAMRQRLHDLGAKLAGWVSVTLITADDSILPTHARGVRRRLQRALARKGVNVYTGERVAEVTGQEVRCASGKSIPYDTLVWTTHAASLPWLRASGLATDDRGFVLVDETLRSVSHPNVFAAGDAASLQHAPRPKSGVFAVREGPYLADNLLRQLDGRPPVPYRPQARHLSLLSTGDRRAVASWGPLSAEGNWVWRWKDRIDRTWMSKYQVEMSMAPTKNGPDGAIPCAGCGAKLGHAILERALARLESMPRTDVLVGLDAPDDAAVVEIPHGMLAVHSIDHFPTPLADPFIAGKVTAVHCLSDLYAMGAAPHTALAIATLPESHPGVQEDTLVDLLAGALSVLMPEHTALVGGHTLQGVRAEFGLSVNGVIARERLMHGAKPAPGDVLILTKPIGVGAVLAADMRRQARPDPVADAIAAMTQSNAEAARILFSNGATACTDITGFGLAGHLRRLLLRHGVSCSIELAQVPLLRGALTAERAGIRSTLYPQNAVAAADIEATESTQAGPAYALLFDPQTAGGLLASVPADAAQSCVEALHASGYARAAAIGRIGERKENSPCIRLL